MIYRIADLLEDLIAAVDTARAAVAGDPAWLDAINCAYSWLLEQETVTVNGRAHYTVAMPSDTIIGRTYYVNGSCQCQGYQRGFVCKHRVRARLIIRALERRQASQALSPEAHLTIADADARYATALAEVNELFN